MTRTRTALACLAFSLTAATAWAQYAGPGAAPQVRSVAEALKAADDTPVVIEGRILRQVGKEKYLFSDGKAEIRVEIDAKHFPTVRVDENTRLRLRGEVEKDFLESPEIDVDHVEVLG